METKSVGINQKDDMSDPKRTSDETFAPEANRHQTVSLGGVDYQVSFSQAQWDRLKTIIRPKPVPSDADRATITADHIQSVYNVWMLIMNITDDVITLHDSLKLKQTEEEHHVNEPHHWPLDGYDTSDGLLPVWYVIEAICDYAATTIGRGQADRPMDWLKPTNNMSLADVVSATYLVLLDVYDLATVEPKPTKPGFRYDKLN